MSAYFMSAEQALKLLQTAMIEAAALLPQQVLTTHWQAKKHAPSAWRAVEAHYRGHGDCDPEIMNVLTHLALMSEAIACLTSVTTPEKRSDEPPDLSLKKMKRLQ